MTNGTNAKRWDRNNPETSGSSGDWKPLPTDTYIMEIVEARLEEDTFAEPDEQGVRPEKLVIVWEPELTDDQIDDGATEGTRVYQRFNPFYGDTKRGPSKLKAFADSLMDQGLLPEQFGESDLVGIKQRCVVELYTKTQGVNKGQPGNKITSVLPLKKSRKAQPKPEADEGSMFVEEPDDPKRRQQLIDQLTGWHDAERETGQEPPVSETKINLAAVSLAYLEKIVRKAEQRVAAMEQEAA